MKQLKIILGLIFFFGIVSCSNQQPEESTYQTTGSIDMISPDLAKIIDKDAKIEVLKGGFIWSEGPLWLGNEQKLIFTDVPSNIIYEWSEKDGLLEYLKPSGYTQVIKNSGIGGGNGLLLNEDGSLIICQHGDRRVAKMLSSTSKPEPEFETLAGTFEGKRFNSPNDAVYDNHGNLYFTDPPYGLKGQDDDPAKELAFNGVYSLAPNGALTLLIDDLTRPNGIALSPDNRKLYVANSDPERCLWMVYDHELDGTIKNGKVFFDATEMYDGKNGLADGLKVDKKGNVFATGPGGVLIFSPEGKHLGTIKTGYATANCCFNQDQSVLYMTAHTYLMRVALKK